MGSVVSQFFDQENALQKKSNKNGYKSDMSFMELEKIKEMEEHLKQQMIWAGRPHVGRLVAFQKSQRRTRTKGRRTREKSLLCTNGCVLYSICGLAVFVPTLFLILTIFQP